MIYAVDLRDQVVLLINGEWEVVDAFRARGKTSHVCEAPVSHYTYRGLLTLPGSCLLCGRGVAELARPCVSSGGFHAIAGAGRVGDVPWGHRAENRTIDYQQLTYDEWTFFVERENLFPASSIAQSLAV